MRSICPAPRYAGISSMRAASRYMRGRRLDRCLFELAGATRKCGAVCEVAHRWGFQDPTAFNRLFGARFGMSPSKCFADPGAVIDASPTRLIHTF